MAHTLHTFKTHLLFIPQHGEKKKHTHLVKITGRRDPEKNCKLVREHTFFTVPNCMLLH